MTEARAVALAELDRSWSPEKVDALLEEMAALAKRAREKKRGGRLETATVLHEGKPAELWCNGVRVA